MYDRVTLIKLVKTLLAKAPETGPPSLRWNPKKQRPLICDHVLDEERNEDDEEEYEEDQDEDEDLERNIIVIIENKVARSVLEPRISFRLPINVQNDVCLVHKKIGLLDAVLPVD